MSTRDREIWQDHVASIVAPDQHLGLDATPIKRQQRGFNIPESSLEPPDLTERTGDGGHELDKARCLGPSKVEIADGLRA